MNFAQPIRSEFGHLPRNAWEIPPAVSLVLLAVLTVGLYANSLHAPFVFDDHYLFTRFEGTRSIEGALKAPPARRIGLLSFALNYEAHGFWLPGYHGVNIAIHFLAGVALYLVVRRTIHQINSPFLQGAAGGWVALFSAAAWLAHPLQTSSVTYVIQRFESLMGMFIFASLYALSRANVASWTRFAWCLLSVALGGLAIFTKEVAIVLPVIALAFDRIYLANSWRVVLRQRAGLHAAFAALALWAVYLSRVLLDPESKLSAGFGVPGITPWQYLRSQPGILLHYLRLSFWPDYLCLDYTWPVANAPGEIYPAGLFILLLLGTSLWALWRFPRVGFLGFAFFVMLAPTSSFIPLLDLAFEHRMYVPLASIVILVSLGVIFVQQRWLRQVSYSQGMVIGGVLAIIAVLGGRSIARNYDYASAIQMWKSVVAARPDSARARLMLAANLTDQGLLEEAEQHLKRAIVLSPGFSEAYVSLGAIRLRQGEIQEAERLTRVGLLNKRTIPVANLNLGRLRERQERLSEAMNHFRLAVEADSAYLAGWKSLGALAEKMNQDLEALKALKRIMEIDPLAADAEPRLIMLMAKSKDPRVSDVPSALEMAVKLNKERSGRDRWALVALGTAQWSNGDYDKARESLAVALKCPGDSESRRCIQELKLVLADSRTSLGKPLDSESSGAHSSGMVR